MSKPSFLTESIGRKSLFSFLIIFFLLTVIINQSFCYADEDDTQEAFRQIVQRYIQTGEQQYEKGYYEQAQKTFLMTQSYRKYLSEAEQTEIDNLLEKAQTAISNRKSAQEVFRLVQEQIKQGKFAQARSHLEIIKNNEYLSADELAKIAKIIGQIDSQTNTGKTDSEEEQVQQTPESDVLEVKQTYKSIQEQEETARIYTRSLGLYNSGQLEEAREGFTQVVNSGTIPSEMERDIEDYLTQIDNMLAQRAENNSNSITRGQNSLTDVVQAEMMATSSGASSGQNTYIDEVNQKINTIRSYTEVIVGNAQEKANDYMAEGQFELAKQAVQTAEITVNQNQMYLGDELYNQYTAQLKALNEEIIRQQEVQEKLEEELRQESADEQNRLFIEQREAERQQSIAELLANAREYKAQGLYQAAHDQLTSLLAIDERNNEALILRDELEDIIYFRDQRELEREAAKQSANILLKADEAKIPYAEDLTYPKNWREISEKRVPDKPIGLNEIDAAVYEQLEMRVDLSMLSPDMGFADVINIMRNSVDPPLKIQPNWRDLLDMADLDQATPAEMDPLSDVKLGRALEVLLAGLSITDLAELDYVVDEGVIMIATTDSLPSNMTQRVYDISDLVGQPSTGGNMGMGNMGFGNMGFGNQGFGNQGFGNQGFNQGFGNQGFGNQGFNQGFGNQGFINQGFGNQGFGNQGFNQGFGNQGFGNQGFGNQGFGNQGFGNQGFGNQGYGNQGFGYGNQGFGGGGGNTGAIANELIMLIEETIDPESWFDISEDGEGSIFSYPAQQPRKLAVYNTHEVHQEIEKLLDALRQSLGHQVSIEARYLIVTENFLEDVGLDVDFTMDLGGRIGMVEVQQGSFLTSTPDPSTKVTGSLGGVAASAGIAGGYGSILDDLQVTFLLRATQARTDSKSLVAPLVTVLNSETATFSVSTNVSYMLPPVTSTVVTPSGVGPATSAETVTPQVGSIPLTIPLNVTPTITHDKKNVILNIYSQFQDVSRIRTHVVDYLSDGEVTQFRTEVPETETINLTTRVSVPDGGTLLTGGHKISAEVEKEAGVPVLSKIPLLGRLFTNSSTIKDQKILLILVKPTIILQEEREEEALSSLGSEY